MYVQHCTSAHIVAFPGRGSAARVSAAAPACARVAGRRARASQRGVSVAREALAARRPAVQSDGYAISYV